MFFLQMSENDSVTGRHLSDIPEAIEEIYEVCEVNSVVIRNTCVDALLGTDLRTCSEAEERIGNYVVFTYMYALMREGQEPTDGSCKRSDLPAAWRRESHRWSTCSVILTTSRVTIPPDLYTSSVRWNQDHTRG